MSTRLSACAAALLAGSLLSSWSAAAQESVDADEITVTATRVKTGFEAPTPVTAISVEDLQARGTVNVADFLNEIPSFTPTMTPATTSLSSRENGNNTLDLRGIGANRTLVLINGRRHVPTASNGTVNLNVVPSIALSRVEVVTGGASASWGSDAVAGVVNLIADKKLDGARIEVQQGISQRGDAQNFRIGGAVGSELAGGRGYLMLAAEYQRDKGVGAQSDRSWGRKRWGLIGNPADTGPNDGIPAQLIAQDVNLFFANEGGLVLGGHPAIHGIRFGPGGTLVPNDFGEFNDGNSQVGGDGGNMGQYSTLSVPYSRTNVFAQGDYDVTDDISLFFEAGWARTHAVTETVQSFAFPAAISAQNPFIPAAFRTLLEDNGVAGFNLFRLNTDIGFITADTTTETFRGLLGLKGNFSDAWSWETYYEYGQTKFDSRQLNNLIVANFRNAVDVVEDPLTGNPVCRATLTGGAPGCQPLNPFGHGSPSQAAIDYVNGTGLLQSRLTQQVVAGSINGVLFDLGAGPVGFAAGAEYRKEKVRSSADETSINNGFLIVNAQPFDGGYHVVEGFAEVAAPLIAGKPGIELLEVNGAIRVTDYSTMGSVVTWKLGANWSPIPDLRFRGTISRDIRAPNIGELFATTRLSFANVLDPVTETNTFTPIITGGNPDLDVEKADNKTFGVVFQPGWAEGLKLSVDYYDIKIKDAINSLAAQEAVNLCAQGYTDVCSTITRDGSGTITRISAQLINVASLRTKGLDFEASYRVPESSFLSLGGRMTARVLATHVMDKEFSPNGAVVFERAGEVNPNANISLSVPHWRGTASLNYDRDAFSGFLQTRYVGSAKYDNSFTIEDINDNKIGAQWYFNIGARLNVEVADNKSVQFFAGVNNVFDNNPPAVPLNFLSALATNPIFYDVIGRSFFAGVRAAF
ncbi:TonB-dependent receptor domain-containing protein [Sphingosinicella microcystinivorans]|uniref:TonB-dependent receptor domain-containing protein n=1 Tax=Sphingosinicella microcystinivorans TaxID=335406 RepID=UPI0022F3BDAC|nr:TonB-dependent receptor [Sphingosinicella microcystinivorans]WBX84531.1 TonB-dependent receptor [Sphingosinicella microcystinivorans]